MSEEREGKTLSIIMDPGAGYIIRELNQAGFEAYAVGGCVRDALLRKDPEDWDITTSAMPEEIKALFPKTFDTGIEHGTVSVLCYGKTYEVTTYRTDGIYLDHRHPQGVSFTTSLLEDVARRDFTINAMAYHPEEGIIDFFNGREDLEKKIIRCVGEPEKRFGEDALRMLRAVRFAARLSFEIEPATKAAITKLSPTLAAVSKERVMDEITKTLMGPHPEGLAVAEETGLLPYMAKGFTAGKPLDYISPGYLPKDRALRFAALLQHFTPKEAEAVLIELKSDNETKRRVLHLLSYIDEPLFPGEEGKPTGREHSAAVPEDLALNPCRAGRWMRALMKDVGRSETGNLLLLKAACRKEDVKRALEVYEQEKDAPVTLAELAVTGKDLLEQGIEQGKQVGFELNRLLDRVVEDPSVNTKERLLEIVKTK